MNPSSDLIPEYANIQSATQGGSLDTQYLTLKAEGPVVDRLFYEAFVTMGTGSTLSWLADPNSTTAFLLPVQTDRCFLGRGFVVVLHA